MNAPTAPTRFNATPLLAACAVAVLIAAIWWLARKPDARPDGPAALPGNEAAIRIGRSAVLADGDSVDPLDQAVFLQNGKPLPIATGAWEKRWRVLAFFDPSAGPVEARIRTRFRNFERTLPVDGAAEPLELQRIDLGWSDSLPAWGVPDTSVAFALDGKALAIGAATGSLKLLPFNPASEQPGEPLLNKNIAEGLIKDLAFAADGAVLVAGEQSPDGFVYGFDAKNGKELWKFPLASELGNERSPGRDSVSFYSLPGVMRVLPVTGDDVLVLGLHAWKSIVDGKEQKHTRCRVYRLDARTGTVRWRYPADQPANRNITWIAATPDGSRIAGVQSIPGAGQAGAATATLDLMVLDGKTGAETGRLSFEPLPPFTSTYAWQSLALQADGRSGMLGAGDGRVWAFDLNVAGEPAMRWKEGPGTPIEVGGTPYHCSIGWGAASERGFFFTVGQSSVQFGSNAPRGFALDLHPEAMSIQAYGTQPATKAEKLWRFDAPGDPQGLWLAPTGRWLAFACQREAGVDSTGAPAPGDYGVAMLDLAKDGPGAKKLAYRFATEGPLFFRAAFSADGHCLAVTEGPRRNADKLSTTRTYRLLILH